ncbi:hypothetical protein CAI21_11560 [Alkalilimnicola ehrlichii]|uniref:Uncharacterized protein n=1 Tax=Alkalilimnicola ehrlichii TaxID=351052 RepID=A0A3E0WRS1_9GAMM|nr:hypothetical protein [Alkalilimnicola ehrlichii]RFA28505.1 hypothetical protein CAI21_11560 [Alkalilimnicola ehrlichii]RFA35670.1 hypothetical protein CAL65_12095 [Alkalilimnicola ehrlichii]
MARNTLQVDEEELATSLEQLSNVFRELDEEEPISILAVEEQGEFAIAVTRFRYTESPDGMPELRPIVMVQDDGAWRVDWELMGMEPVQALAMSPLAHQLEPLYDWYNAEQEQLELEIVAGTNEPEPSG